MIERRTIRFDHELLAGVELPCFEATGARDGPHLCLLGGIHGGEYSSIAAVVRFMNALDTSELSGRITAVPDREHAVVPRAHARSSSRRTARTSTVASPARATGRSADALARHVFDELIAPSDVLIDLHGGDMVEALEPFALYDESRVEEQARGARDRVRPAVRRALRSRRGAGQRDDQLRGGVPLVFPL